MYAYEWCWNTMHKICEMKPSMVFASLPLLRCPIFWLVQWHWTEELKQVFIVSRETWQVNWELMLVTISFFFIYKVDFVTFHSAVSKKWGWQTEFQRIVQEGQVLLAWSESLPWPSISWCLRLHNDPRTQHKCQVQASDENHAWVILSAEVWSMSVLLLANYTAELSRPNAMQVSAFVEYRRRLTWRPICKIRNARTQRQTRYPFFRSDGMAGSAVSNSSLID